MKQITIEKQTGVKRGTRDYSVNGGLYSFPLDYEKEFTEKVKRINEKLLKRESKKNSKAYKAIKREHSIAKQNTDEWLLERVGEINASNTPFKKDGTPVNEFDNYVSKKVSEYFAINFLGEELEEGYTSKAMLDGHIKEEEAIERYSIETLTVVERPNRTKLDGLRLGASLDGYVARENKGLEVKSPATPNNYLRELTHGYMLNEYITQVNTQILTCNLDSVDFIVYYKGMELLVINVKRDEVVCNNMFETLKMFEESFESKLESLKSKVL